MKQTYLYLTIIILLWIVQPINVAAQSIYNFTQFYFNPALLNPSFTGSDGRTALYLSYKKQWAGINGSPSLANLNLQSPVNARVSMGVNMANEKNGLLSSSSALFTGGYTLPIAENHLIRFGMSLGISSTKVDVNALAFGTAGDPLLADLARNTFRVLGNFGVSYHYHSFHFGASVPNILQPDYVSKDAFTLSKVKPFESIILHASNRFYFAGGKNIFEPYLVYRLNGSLPSQFELAGVVHLQNKLFVGVSYKQDFGISALAGFNINKQTAIGYSYTIKNTGINELNRPSHEVHFAYLFGKRKKEIPMYSFVDTEKEKPHRKTAQQLAAEKKKREAAELANKKTNGKKPQQVTAQKTTTTTPTKSPVTTAAVATATQATVQVVKPKTDEEKADSVRQLKALHNGGPRRKAERDLLANQSEIDSIHNAEKAHLNRLIEHAENPTEHHNEDNHPNAERHEFVKQGEHHAELEVGDYVIAGVFRMEENAQKFSVGLIELGFNEADYGYLTEKALWYVHISRTNDIKTARAYRDKFRKMKIFREAWLLTVHK